MATNDVTDDAVDALYEKLNAEAEAGGYHLNPDAGFAKELVRSLLVNEQRYGYWACPCRLASGDKDDDLDIICPCDYRDPDLSEYGSCYCALYVSTDVLEGKRQAGSIPERRPTEEERRKPSDRKTKSVKTGKAAALSFPLWRCKVCGYLCARDGPPDVCPVCKVTKERFERFLDTGASLSTAMPVWRCRVCGYVCARNEPPDTCPICKAKKERFESLLTP